MQIEDFHVDASYIILEKGTRKAIGKIIKVSSELKWRLSKRDDQVFRV